MKEQLKSIGTFILGACVLVAVMFIATMLIKGSVWLSERAYPWLVVITLVTIVVVVFLLLPLAIFRRTRGFAGSGIYIASYVFGLTLWVWSLLVSYSLWGIGGVLVGLFLAGIGVVPIAILASLFNGFWSTVGQLVLVLVITMGTRMFGAYLIGNAEEHNDALRLHE